MEYEREHADTNEPPLSPLPARFILGMRVDATTYDDAALRVLRWAESRESRYVCAVAVNNAVQAHDDASYKSVMNEADLVTPDGVPLTWAMRLLGCTGQRRVYGPRLTEVVCELAELERVPVGFYGSSPEVLSSLVGRVRVRWPALNIAYSYSPPFRELTPEEDARASANIAASGARIVFVGLGSPKQDRWMAEHRGRIPAVMLGVGAAFDFISGNKPQAPSVMQRVGLEWLFRLATEPRRLWRRYLVNNPRFVGLFTLQLLRRTSGTNS